MPSLVRPDGCRIHYELFGSPGSPVLTLLEGIGADIPGWRRSIPALAGELRVVAIDHRGNGASDDPPGPCTMTTFVEDVLAVLDELGVERAHVYGQSFGGMMAQEAALTHPDAVRTLILAGTHPGPAHAIAVVDRTVPKGEPWRALYAPGFPEAHPDVVADDRRGRGRPARPSTRAAATMGGDAGVGRLRPASADLRADAGAARDRGSG